MYAVLVVELGPEPFRHQVQGLLLHRAPLDGVDDSVVGPGVRLYCALDEVGDGGLSAGWRAKEQEDALAYLESLGGGGEVLNYAVQRLLQAEYLALEQAVYTVAIRGYIRAPGSYCVVDVGVGEATRGGVFSDHAEVVREGPFPGVPGRLALGLGDYGLDGKLVSHDTPAP